MAAETFRTDWRGWARSSDGYAVRIVGRNDLQYRDGIGELSLFVEPTANWKDLVVETSMIPDLPDRPRAEVVSRLERVFAFRGWTMIEAGP